MSSKISLLYSLTEYPIAHIMDAWPRSRYKAFNANGADTLGFPDKIATENQKCALSANHRIGTRPVSLKEKRRNGVNVRNQRPRCERSRCVGKLNDVFCRVSKLLDWGRGYMTTMTMESSEQKMTITTVRPIRLGRIKSSFLGGYLLLLNPKKSNPLARSGWEWAVRSSPFPDRNLKVGFCKNFKKFSLVISAIDRPACFPHENRENTRAGVD